MINQTTFPNGGPLLDQVTTAIAVSSSYDSYGLNNTINAAKLAIAVV